ncbi:retroviral-like aspartic protease family protein [Alicyclobacillus tolerans]|uniref:retroviral-like aspartic protease family protein n=1 Tax=Alicyclobacillus tolerans TaxID=90970 RepID=UPI001F3A8F3E|nr:retroviral-like aspartic protease family protein [Alicyclobacillus tolerans]MCF8565162.1 retroviral-like aspartic protease family protein [Alicyclobacillus tolerans]
MASYTELASVSGSIQNDAFYFTLNVNGTDVPGMIMDTGAFELTFNGNVANQLGLPNLGAIQIGGVGGSASAYQSVCNLNIGGQTYSNVPCIVDPSFSGAGLFGLRFFVDNQLALALDTVNQVLLILSPSASY